MLQLFAYSFYLISYLILLCQFRLPIADSTEFESGHGEPNEGGNPEHSMWTRTPTEEQKFDGGEDIQDALHDGHSEFPASSISCFVRSLPPTLPTPRSSDTLMLSEFPSLTSSRAPMPTQSGAVSQVPSPILNAAPSCSDSLALMLLYSFLIALKVGNASGVNSLIDLQLEPKTSRRFPTATENG